LMAEARAHFADHCAICHANNGSGNTEIGQNLYPKAPDMRLRQTQNLTDGELYYTTASGSPECLPGALRKKTKTAGS
jgi:mono/diheme cytochrome c family protein